MPADAVGIPFEDVQYGLYHSVEGYSNTDTQGPSNRTYQSHIVIDQILLFYCGHWRVLELKSARCLVELFFQPIT